MIFRNYTARAAVPRSRQPHIPGTHHIPAEQTPGNSGEDYLWFYGSKPNKILAYRKQKEDNISNQLSLSSAARLTQAKARMDRLEVFRRRNRTVAYGVVFGLSLCSLIPYGYRSIVGTKIDSDKALTGSQIQRGMYMNQSNKDIGPDPNYDFKTGTYMGYRPPPQLDSKNKNKNK